MTYKDSMQLNKSNAFEFEKMASPYLDRAKDTRKRLDSCWDLDLAWDKYPEVLKEVCNIAS